MNDDYVPSVSIPLPKFPAPVMPEPVKRFLDQKGIEDLVAAMKEALKNGK